MKLSCAIYSGDSLLICLNTGTKKKTKKSRHSLVDEANCIPDAFPSKFYVLRTDLTYRTNICSIFKTNDITILVAIGRKVYDFNFSL